MRSQTNSNAAWDKAIAMAKRYETEEVEDAPEAATRSTTSGWDRAIAMLKRHEEQEAADASAAVASNTTSGWDAAIHLMEQHTQYLSDKIALTFHFGTCEADECCDPHGYLPIPRVIRLDKVDELLRFIQDLNTRTEGTPLLI